MQVILDGALIVDERSFHEAVASSFGFPDYYGYNLNALWDCLTVDVPRPATIVWKNSIASRRSMGERFDVIVALLRKVESNDIDIGVRDGFRLALE